MTTQEFFAEYSTRELSDLWNTIERYLKIPVFHSAIVVYACHWAKHQILVEMIRRYDVEKGITS